MSRNRTKLRHDLLTLLPVYSLDQLDYTLEHNQIACVFLSEPNLSAADRQRITGICGKHGIELRESRVNKVMPDGAKGNSLQFIPISYDEGYGMSQEEAWLQSILSGDGKQ